MQHSQYITIPKENHRILQKPKNCLEDQKLKNGVRGQKLRNGVEDQESENGVKDQNQDLIEEIILKSEEFQEFLQDKAFENEAQTEAQIEAHNHKMTNFRVFNIDETKKSPQRKKQILTKIMSKKLHLLSTF